MEFVCQYDVREILGQGSFSEVKRCVDKRTRQAFAVKEMTYDTEEQRERIEQQIQVSCVYCLIRVHETRLSARLVYNI